MKQTKVYGDNLAGFHNRKSNEVGINLTSLWNISYDCAEDYFIEKFSQVMLHEQLHRIIYELGYTYKSTELGEEKVVRILSNMPFNKRAQEDYK